MNIYFFITKVTITINPVFNIENRMGLLNSEKEHFTILTALYHIMGDGSRALRNSEATTPVTPHREDRG